MSLSPAFLDQLRERTTLSALVGRSLKLIKAGREFKACCPFHQEKTASFTINDEKGFYHCFGCGAHGDALRWLTDQGGLGFIDAVKELAAAAGMEVPAPSAEAAQREQAAESTGEVLATAAAWFADRLRADPGALKLLEARGIGEAAIARFGLGLAPGRQSVGTCGAPPAALATAGLLVDTSEGYRDRFRGRIMVPIHDPRGRPIGFGGRATRDGQEAKWINSAETEAFDKGRTLFNLHRAAPASRALDLRRLIIVEGYFDVIALDQVGIAEVVAPMGTAITDAQLERAWRVHHAPILMLDGDAAGRRAALRACERAIAHVGPGKTLQVAVLPEGQDPDDLARSGGRDAVEAVLAAAEPLEAWLWGAVLGEGVDESRASSTLATPEGASGLWARLAGLARTIRDPETQAQYLAAWRRRFDAAFPPPPPGLSEEDLRADGRVGADGSMARLDVQAEVVRARLRLVAGDWLFRQVDASHRLTPAELGRIVWGLGRRVAAGLILVDDARAAIGKLRERCADAAIKDIDDAFDAGERKGFDLGPMLVDMGCSGHPLTDKGNAMRFRDRMGRDYLYTTAKGWLGWDGRRYRVLDQEKDSTPAEVMAAVFDMVDAIQDEARFVAASGMRDPLGTEPTGMDELIVKGNKADKRSDLIAKWGRASESAGKLGCIANLAKRWLTVAITDFDVDPMLLNCPNGTLRFHRKPGGGSYVELGPHRREDMLTKLTACDYDPDAPAPIYRRLIEWAQPDAGMRRYLRQWAGYNLTGDMGEQVFHIWYGPTAANGKSTVGNAWREAIGDYGDVTNVETFLDEGVKKRGDQATPDIVRLPGVRLLTAGEPPKGAKVNEALINSVTGGDPMLARDNFRSFFRFSPAFKFTLWCNSLPAIPQGTEGIWRRVKVVKWDQHLEPHERDRDLPRKLVPEYAGILAWMVRGLVDWMDHGFVEPDAVQVASADYRDDSDPLASFLRMCTVPEEGGRVQSSHLYELFCAWCKAAGETEWKQKGFSRAMKDRGFSNKQSNGMQWLGLKMVRQVGDFIDEHGKVRASIGVDVMVDGSRVSPVEVTAPGEEAWHPPDDIDDDGFVPGFD